MFDDCENNEDKKQKRCEACNAKIVNYSHKLNAGLVTALKKMYDHSDTMVHLGRLDLTYNQRCNFPKLKYWGLVQQGKLSGYWYLTKTGGEFVEGHIGVPSHMVTYRNEVVGAAPDPVFFRDLYPYTAPQIVGYDKREDYANNAEPHYP